MTTIRWSSFLIEPADTLFFRDGRPFSQQDEGLAEAISLFPPHPTTMAGALRAGLARRLGWRDEDGDWSVPATSGAPPLSALLGSASDPGPLRFAGPFPVEQRHGVDGGALWEPLLPCPLALLARPPQPGEPEGQRFGAVARLAPGTRRLRCDIEPAGATLPALSVPPGDKADLYDTLAGNWLTLAGMRRFLDGYTPHPEAEIVSPGTIWSAQTRLGLSRDNAHHATIPGQLYLASHARLREGFALTAAIGCAQEAPPDLAPLNPMPLGGEGRSAWVSPTPIDLTFADLGPALESLDVMDGTLRYVVVLLTPARIEGGWDTPAGADGGFGGLPGRIVTACLGRPVLIGGWSSLGAGGPSRSAAYLPPGSTWFMAADLARHGPEPSRSRAEILAAVAAVRARGLGRDTEWGFGRFLVGRWMPAIREAPPAPSGWNCAWDWCRKIVRAWR